MANFIYAFVFTVTVRWADTKLLVPTTSDRILMLAFFVAGAVTGVTTTKLRSLVSKVAELAGVVEVGVAVPICW